MSDAPIWNGASSELGDLFAVKQNVWLQLGSIEREWLDAMSARSAADSTARTWVTSLRSMLEGAMQRDPEQGGRFAAQFEEARRQVYPVSSLLLLELQQANRAGGDDTLRKIDRGVLRAIEDQAAASSDLSSTLRMLRDHLSVKPANRTAGWSSSAYEIFGEAKVHYVLSERCRGRLRIRKIPEGPNSSPDFRCEWIEEVSRPPFYIELKTLDVVGGRTRLAEMQAEGFDSQLDIERQQARGRRFAISTRIAAPFRKTGADPDYDPRSIRMMVERTGAKVASAFKNSQFADGPTFAMASLDRLLHFGQGPEGLRRTFVTGKGARETGAWWALGYGQMNEAVFRKPEFEGASGADGHLARSGFLVDPSITIDAAGLLLMFDESGPHIVGLKAVEQPKRQGWDEKLARQALDLLCDGWNDESNSREQPHYWS